ncbi:MAG: GNAT family N-acetyltransferase [Bacteroidota bacterium]
MNTIIKKFSELSIQQLYEILQLRSEVFVVEQDCVYQDIDGQDQTALHILIYENEDLVGYARIFAPETYAQKASIGRVVVREKYRLKNYGHLLINKSIDAVEQYFSTKEIELSAQQYLINFYESHGFRTSGKGYLEDGIPHIRMLRNGI